MKCNPKHYCVVLVALILLLALAVLLADARYVEGRASVPQFIETPIHIQRQYLPLIFNSPLAIPTPRVTPESRSNPR